ncbi:hypothetical protein KR067_010785, partial [Drosophila pandora]
NSCPISGKGIYHIKLSEKSALEAPCNGSGWMVIQRRMDGSVDFGRNWTEYRDGFGNLRGEFFIGLQNLHLITKSRQHELLIRLGKVDGSTAFVKYDNFRIGSEKDFYLLESVGNHTGGAGDSLNYHLNMKFSTTDRDNDLAEGSCAKWHGGGWWFRECAERYMVKKKFLNIPNNNFQILTSIYSCLNGGFHKDGKMKNSSSIYWGSWYNYDYSVSLTFVEMMIRPKPF